MKLRNLFFLLLALPLVFAACEVTPEPTPDPTPENPTPENPDPENPDPENPAPEYVCDVDFAYSYRIAPAELGLPDNYFLIAFLDETEECLLGVVLVGDEGDEVLATGTYTAEGGNLLLEGCELYTALDEYYFEGGDGTVKVVLSAENDGYYTFDIEMADADGNLFHFDYAGYVDGMEIVNNIPTEAVNFTASYFDGDYFAQEYSETYNANIYFSDKGFDEEGYVVGGGTYYSVDIYTAEAPVIDAEGYLIVPEGEYFYDVNTTGAANSISYDYSGYFAVNDSATAYTAQAFFDDARLVVTADSATLYVVVGGVDHTVVYNGVPKFYVGGGSVAPSPEGAFVASEAYAFYYGDYYSPGVSDNYYFFLSDLGVDEDGFAYAGGTYYRFDIYAPISDDATIACGTYEIDPYDSCEVWTVGTSYSAYFKYNESGDDYDAVDYPESGYITFNEDGSIEAEVTMLSGNTHNVVFPAGGEIVIYDAFEDDDEGGSDYEGVLSTLTDNYTCVFDNHVLYYESYGDWYEIGLQNFAFVIVPIDAEGDCVSFDVLAGPDSTSFAGTYAINDTLGSYTSDPGEIDGGYLAGSWYYTHDYVTMAPFIDGTVYVTANADGTMSVSFAAYDDAYNYIEGSWTGDALSYSAASTRSGSLKQMRSVVLGDAVAPVVAKERIEVKAAQQNVAVKGLKLR